MQPTYFFVILDCFLPFYAPRPPPLPPCHTHTQPKNSKFWNNEKKAWRYYHFTHVCHIPIICMVPEIWSMTDQIFCHFGPIFAFYLTKTRKIKILKNEKITHKWRYGARQNFCLTLIDELEKQLLKELLSQ